MHLLLLTSACLLSYPQKFENAKKLGILSLSEHGLDEVPGQLFAPELKKLRTLDLSMNNLTQLGNMGSLVELKFLNLDNNKLPPGSLAPVTFMTKLQNLSVCGNRLGKPAAQDPSHARRQQLVEAVPELPPSLKQLNLASNFFSHVPRHILSQNLIKLEILDLSGNHLAVAPLEVANLVNLLELNLDNNAIVALPEEIGSMKKLKVLSLRNNQLRVTSTTFSDKSPQPLPKSLFTDTHLIDLNLHGNQMTNTQLNQFEGFQDFLDRRQKVKSKTMSNLDVCGLE
jgi:Leucine-rich repeat (LRR) protein